jgi:hypothetical protein
MIRAVAVGIAFALATATAAMAQSAEDEAACRDDAFRVCGQTIPDRERTFQCMIANRAILSAPCQAVIARDLPPDPVTHKASARRSKKSQGPINLSPAAAK